MLWALILVAVGCTGEIAKVGRVTVGQPQAHGNLTVYPLYRTQWQDQGEDFITLEEGLNQKLVDVRETGPDSFNRAEGGEVVLAQAGTVNALEVENRSGKSLYILAGQVVTGGKQDRVIAKDTIVPPDEKLEVEVCCVEQGRWAPRRSAEGGGMALAFNACTDSVAQSDIKRVIQDQGRSAQSEVWEAVSTACCEFGAETGTTTYDRVLVETEGAVKEYLDLLDGIFQQDEKICGFVACVNGEVETCDLFVTPALLARFRTSLLRGYALDALRAGEKEGRDEDAGIDAVQAFMKELLLAEEQAESHGMSRHARREKLETARLIGFTNYAPGSADSGQAMHVNAYTKKQ
jgi:hypothetical protein